MPDPSGRSFGPSARHCAPRAPSAPSSRPGTRAEPTTSRPSTASSRCSGRERASRPGRRRTGLRFLLPSPAEGGACKRAHLFLRWMVRSGDVDLGLWTGGRFSPGAPPPPDGHPRPPDLPLPRPDGPARRPTFAPHGRRPGWLARIDPARPGPLRLGPLPPRHPRRVRARPAPVAGAATAPSAPSAGPRAPRAAHLYDPARQEPLPHESLQEPDRPRRPRRDRHDRPRPHLPRSPHEGPGEGHRAPAAGGRCRARRRRMRPGPAEPGHAEGRHHARPLGPVRQAPRRPLLGDLVRPVRGGASRPRRLVEGGEGRPADRAGRRLGRRGVEGRRWLPREAERGRTSPLALDPKKSAASAFGTEKFPETWFLSPDGEVLLHQVGPQDWSSPGRPRRSSQAPDGEGARRRPEPADAGRPRAGDGNLFGPAPFLKAGRPI